MKYLIFSDSHGGGRGMLGVIERSLAFGIDGVLFLGDGLSDIERAMELFPSVRFHAVAGNCDLSAKYIGSNWREKLIEADGVRILMMHGHHHSVKAGTDSAIAYARSRGADVLLFGHTHVPLEKYIPSDGENPPLYVFNPGSAFLPQFGEPTFGTLTIRNGSILLSHGKIHGGAR